jgi:hypothetical protein
MDVFSVTFFATPDDGLRRPRRRKRHLGTLRSLDDLSVLLETYSHYDLPEIMAEAEDLDGFFDPSKDKERRKALIKMLVKAILFYHVVPKGTDIDSLTHNTTYATNLIVPDYALDHEALRVRVSTKIIPPSVQINFFSTVVKANIGAKNGVIHVINHPLFPPPSIFQELFLVPRIFGAVVSRYQTILFFSSYKFWADIRSSANWSDRCY